MKKILALVLALCMMFTMFACGAKTETPAAEAAPAAPAHSTVAGEPEEADVNEVIRRVIAELNR